MRAPAAKTLVETFRISLADAKLIREIAKATDDPTALGTIIAIKCPKTEKYVMSMHNSPYNSHIWRVTVALHAMDEIMGTHGVEGLSPTSGREGYAPPYEYLNTGDTYGTTLIYHRKSDAIRIGNWGDIVERHPSWE